MLNKLIFFLFFVSKHIPVSYCYFGESISFLKDVTYCKFTECCNDQYVSFNFTKLKENLDQHLFGQHIAQKYLLDSLRIFYNSEYKSTKPLVLSFHGTPGVGKTFVSHQLAETIFLNGIKSRFVHRYYGRSNFPDDSLSLEYRKKIYEEVINAIKECPRSMFIFDEVDQMPGGVFESFTTIMDHNQYVNGIDCTQAIFIFISNTASIEISTHLSKLLNNGQLREDTKLCDFEQIIERGAYNIEGGLKEASMIHSHVIDHYIPFLPLEKSHVINCIKAEFKRQGITEASDADIEMLIKQFVTFEKMFGIFATSGCKRVERKVTLLLSKDEL